MNADGTVDPNAQCICDINGTRSQMSVRECTGQDGTVVEIVESPGGPGGGSSGGESPATDA